MGGSFLTNGPGRGPNACQEQQGTHNESCHLGSGAACCSPATCNRHQAGATARSVLSTARVGHWASPLPGNAGFFFFFFFFFFLSGLGLWYLKPHFPRLGSWQGCLSPVVWIARCLAPQGFQLGRGMARPPAPPCPPPQCWRPLLSDDKALLDIPCCFRPACPQILSSDNLSRSSYNFKVPVTSDLYPLGNPKT
jgi:hypothetical protein